MDRSLRISFLKMGISAVLMTGILFFFIAVLACFSPKPIASYVPSELYFKDFQSYKTYFILIKYLMFLGNATMVGVVIALYALKKPTTAWLIVLTILSLLSLGVGMFQSILDAVQIPHLAAQYEASSPMIQHVIIAFGLASPGIYIISLGIPGIWFLFFYLWFRKEFPLLLVLAAVAWGLGNILTVLAHVLIITPLIYSIAFAALIGVPFWTFLQVRFLLKKIEGDK